MATNEPKSKKTAARAKPTANASTTSGAKATSSGGVKAVKANVTSSGAIAAPKVEAKATGTKKPSPKAKAAAKPVATKSTAAKTGSSGGTTKTATPAGSGRSASSAGAVKAPSSAGAVKAPSSAGTVKAATSNGAVKAPSSAGTVKAATSNGAVKAPVVEVTPVDEPTPIETVITQPAPKAAKAAEPARAESAPKKQTSVVDNWARSNLDASQLALLERIRDIVKRVAPQATEVVKWAQPVWERNGPFAFLRPSKKHVTFGFWRGAELPDPRGLLEGAGTRMRHLKIALGEKPPIEAITEFVREAVRRNETAGSPTKRR